MLILLTLAGAQAGYLDLAATSSVGCDPQWVGDCISNPVWGEDDVLGIDTPHATPILTVGASPGKPTKIAVDSSALNSHPCLGYSVQGKAYSSATKISMEVKFLDASNTTIGTHTTAVHTGASGPFSVFVHMPTMPASASSWQSRLVVEDDAAAFAEVGADCFLFPGSLGGCTGNPGPETEDNGDHGCEECSKDCGDWTALGEKCDDTTCNADCYNDDEVEFQSDVTLRP